MKNIEFFGVSNSGKTFYKNKIKNFFYKENLYDYRSIIFNFSKNKIKLSFVDILTLFYFKIIKSDLIKKIKLKNKKKIIFSLEHNNQIKYNKINFFYSNYKKVCRRLFNKLKKKIIKFFNFTSNLIKNLNCSNEFKSLLNFWFMEEFCGYYLSKNYKNKILIDSEGFIQRLLVYLYFSPKKNHFKIIKQYLSLCPLPDKVFVTELKKHKFKKKNYFYQMK